jgi:DNA-3-methyladenine glycosylase
MYNQFNVVTNVENTPHAVLVRALEPVEGLDVIRRRRNGRAEYEWTSGPGRLCIALGIDRRLDKADLLGDRVLLEQGISISPRQIARGPRIGIDYAERWVDKPWRFWIKDNPFVSRKGIPSQRTPRKQQPDR